MRSRLKRLLALVGVGRKRSVRETDHGAPWHYPLTAREAELVALIAAGRTNSQIATHFGFRERAIVGLVGVIMNKLGLSRRAEIAAWVARHRPK